jgi:hypothetical protein
MKETVALWLGDARPNETALVKAGLAALVAALLSLAASLSASALAAEPPRGLAGLPRVALDIVLAPHHPGPVPDDLEQRILDALRQSRPAPVVDPASADRLILVVAVRPVNASELRGFWLPFSGTYGIGMVRLAVERAVTVRGLSGPIPAVVWQAERQVNGPWHRAPADIVALLDELLTAFLEDYRGGGPR